jgi:hypothetical protein
MAVLCGLAAGARAGTGIEVRLDPTAELPFSPDDLGEAIRLRLDRSRARAPLVVSVDRLPEGRFRIGVGGRGCEVALDDQPPTYALRTVALLAVDLAEAEPQVRAPDPAPRLWAGSVAALAIPAGAWGDSRVEGRLEVGRRLTARWWGIAAVGYSRSTREGFADSITVQSVPAQAGLRCALGWGDLRMAAALRATWARQASGTIPGGWLEVRPVLARGPLGTLGLVVAAEVAAQRLEIRPRKGPTVFTSEYVMPWFGVALSSP